MTIFELNQSEKSTSSSTTTMLTKRMFKLTTHWIWMRENPRNKFCIHTNDYVEIKCRHLFDAVNKANKHIKQPLYLLHTLAMQFWIPSFLFLPKEKPKMFLLLRTKVTNKSFYTQLFWGSSHSIRFMMFMTTKHIQILLKTFLSWVCYSY